MLGSAAMWLNDSDIAKWTFLGGALILIYMLVGWFGEVIRESEDGVYNSQVDTSFRMGMLWFIFSEIMFFACFFGALFYARVFSVPWLGGEGTGAFTNEMLWQGYQNVWPTAGPEQLGYSEGLGPLRRSAAARKEIRHGIDIYLDEEEFAHLVEVLGGLEHLYNGATPRH